MLLARRNYYYHTGPACFGKYGSKVKLLYSNCSNCAILRQCQIQERKDIQCPQQLQTGNCVVK